MMRPTLRAALVFAMSIPVALLILALKGEFWYASLYFPVIALTLIGADATMVLPGRRLKSELDAPARLYIGQSGDIDLTLSANGYSRPAAIEALLEQRGTAAPSGIVAGTMAKGRLELKLPVTPLRRGQITVEALWLRWRGPLGLVEAHRREATEVTIDVVPDVRGLQDNALQFFASDAVYGIKAQRLRGEGTEFDTLCDFAQGMDNRFIDWKRSARHHKLLCKEFQQERNHHIVFGYDTGHLMLEPINGIPKLDHAIKAGLLLSWVSLRNGDLVGGCGFDTHFRHFIKPGRGIPHFTRVQKFAAALNYQTEETNFTLGLAELNSRLQRRTLVVLFTEFIDTISAELLIESLQLMVKRHVIIFVTLRDPLLTELQDAAPQDFINVAEAVLADDFLRERAIVLERIARLGVHCITAPVNGVSSALLNRYLMIKQRGLL